MKSVRLMLIPLLIFSGCAPQAFQPAVEYYAKQAKVQDASARRVKEKEFWYLRFNELMMSDLDDAIAAGKKGDGSKMRKLGAEVLHNAADYASQTADDEIQRIPAKELAEVAARAGTESNADKVAHAYRQLVKTHVDELNSRLAADSDDQVISQLQSIRGGIEAAPDDRSRKNRQFWLAWAAPLSKHGLEKVEQKRQQEHPSLLGKVYEEATLWPPPEGKDDLHHFAPEIIIEWPKERDYAEQVDRFGQITLSGSPKHIDVNVNTSRPMMYWYTSEAKINDERYDQLVYVWWYPERPEMTSGDPQAGHIDGDTLRITLDHHHRPAIYEVVQSCGCGHLIFVSDEIEKLACHEFKSPEPERKWCIERTGGAKFDIIVAGLVPALPEGAHPAVYVLAGYHEVSKMELVSQTQVPNLKVHDQHKYEFTKYDDLEHLPLGNGYGSMFGADGLVHNAGRKEGYLLAPTGMMSAGQPRKRGTQKIRWDAYSFDDPHLLERTLRLPKGM